MTHEQVWRAAWAKVHEQDAVLTVEKQEVPSAERKSFLGQGRLIESHPNEGAPPLE